MMEKVRISVNVYNRQFLIYSGMRTVNLYKVAVFLSNSEKFRRWTHFEATNLNTGEVLRFKNGDFIPKNPFK